mmetsp:Transcript_8525/g.12994  ORF Transcript_8525/g.12994 Transcript_8525/m.12994 type:complete len:167 (+) Transcript_8525:74-574(+)
MSVHCWQEHITKMFCELGESGKTECKKVRVKMEHCSDGSSRVLESEEEHIDGGQEFPQFTDVWSGIWGDEQEQNNNQSIFDDFPLFQSTPPHTTTTTGWQNPLVRDRFGARSLHYVLSQVKFKREERQRQQKPHNVQAPNNTKTRQLLEKYSNLSSMMQGDQKEIQ